MPIGLGLLRLAEPFQALSLGFLPAILTSRLHLPAPLRSTSITRLHRYYGCSDSWTGRLAPLPFLYRSPCLRSWAFLSFRLQPSLTFPGGRVWVLTTRALPHDPAEFIFPLSLLFLGRWRHLGFAIGRKARQGHEPNRVHLRYGRIFRLGLLSTPHRCDPVTLSFIRPNLLLTGTLTPLTHYPHRRTDPWNASPWAFTFPPTPNPLPSGKRALRFASPGSYPPPLFLLLSSY